MSDANSPTAHGPDEVDGPPDADLGGSAVPDPGTSVAGVAAPAVGPVPEPGEPGAVQVILQPGRTRIVLSGEVDADLGADLQEATAEAERAGVPIEVDAHHVTFMDSSGVAFLARLATRSGQPVRLLRVPPTVRFLLEATRIGELLDIADDDTD